MVKKVLNLIIIILLISIPAFAGDNAKTGKSRDETVHIRAGHLNYVEDRIEISQGTTIIKGDNTVTASGGIYYRKEKKIVLKDEVDLEHSDGTIKAREMTAWLEQDRYIFTGEVKLQQKMENDKKLKLEAPYLELYQRDNSFKASKGVVIDYNDRILKGEVVNYNADEQTLELTENVQIQEKNGDWVRSEKAIFYLKTGKFTADGEVELEVRL